MTILKEKETQSAATSGKRLAGKVALVTGGSRGIGAAIAQRLAEEGATIAISYASNKKAADEVVANIAELGNKVAAFKASVASPEETKKLIEAVGKEFGKIDILVNNAGVFATAPVEKLDVAHFDYVFDVNVKGVLSTTVAALPFIPAGGRIINISSVAASTPSPEFSVYSASKAALDSLTRVWAQELGPKQITVNGVAPGTTATDMYNQALPDDVKQMYIDKTALRRVGEPLDIANLVLFLASEEGGWVTGQTIRSDGGITF